MNTTGGAHQSGHSLPSNVYSTEEEEKQGDEEVNSSVCIPSFDISSSLKPNTVKELQDQTIRTAAGASSLFVCPLGIAPELQ